MKILIVSDAWHPQVNGVVRTYEYMLPDLGKLGHEVKVIGPHDFPLRMPMPGYNEIDLTLFPSRRLRGMIESFAPDVVHLAVEGPLGDAAKKICRRENIPFNTCYHTQFPDYFAKRMAKHLPFLYAPAKKLGILRVRKFHEGSAAVMVATPGLEKELKSFGFASPLKRLTRGVMTDIFKPGGSKALQELPKPVALYVGRVAIEKNIEAFLSMPWKGGKAVVGSGPSMGELKKKFPDAHFAGRKEGEELAAHYRGADVFVFPSKTDTFGMVLTEALACGLPVAAYDVMGPKDIITEPMLGTLTESDLGQAALSALNAPGSREDRFNHVKDNYTWPLVARQFADICEASA